MKKKERRKLKDKEKAYEEYRERAKYFTSPQRAYLQLKALKEGGKCGKEKSNNED